MKKSLLSIAKGIGKTVLTICIVPFVVIGMVLLPFARLIFGIALTLKPQETGTAPQQILRVNHAKAV